MPDTTKGPTPAPPDRMPTPAKVAAILLGFLATLLLLNAVVGFVQLPDFLDDFAAKARETNADFDREAASSQLKTLFIAGGVVGLATAASCVLLARRNKVGRLLGIGCAAVQLSLSVLNVIAAGGIPNYTLLVMVLTGAILVMLFRRQTLDWLRAERV